MEPNVMVQAAKYFRSAVKRFCASVTGRNLGNYTESWAREGVRKDGHTL